MAIEWEHHTCLTSEEAVELLMELENEGWNAIPVSTHYDFQSDAWFADVFARREVKEDSVGGE